MDKAIIVILMLLLISACKTSDSAPVSIAANVTGVTSSQESADVAKGESNVSRDVAQEQNIEPVKELNVTNETLNVTPKESVTTSQNPTVKAREPTVGVKLTSIPADWEEKGARAGEYCSRDYTDFNGLWDDISAADQKYTLKCLEVNCAPLCKGPLMNKCEMQCQYSGKAYIKQFLKNR